MERLELEREKWLCICLLLYVLFICYELSLRFRLSPATSRLSPAACRLRYPS